MTPSSPPSPIRSNTIASIGSSPPVSELALAGDPARFVSFPFVGTVRRTSSSVYRACAFALRSARKEESGEVKSRVPVALEEGCARLVGGPGQRVYPTKGEKEVDERCWSGE